MSNVEELKFLCDSLPELTGVHVCFYDDKHLLTEIMSSTNKQIFGHFQDFCRAVRSMKNAKRDCFAACNNCDRIDAQIYAEQTRKPFLHRCYIGLTEYIIPLFVNDTYVGIAMVGQSAITDLDDLEKMLDRLELYGGDREEFRRLYNTMSKVTVSKLIRVGRLMELILRSILDRLDISKLNPEQRKNDSILARARQFITDQYTTPISASDVAAEVHVSPSYLSRLFRKEFKIGVQEYINNQRFMHARRLIRQTTMPIYAIAEDAGFHNASYFSRRFLKRFGVTPGQLREEYSKNQEINLLNHTVANFDQMVPITDIMDELN